MTSFNRSEEVEGLIVSPERPKRKVTIEQVSNGFIVHSKNNIDFEDIIAVSFTRKEAKKMAAKFLGK